jgi:hypothetical protein
MPHWIKNDFGLLVPSSPHTYGPPVGLGRLRSLLGEKHCFAKRQRRVTPGVQQVPALSDPGSSDLRRLGEHVAGRGEESVRVLLGAAFLRKADLVGRDDLVSYRGAEFQRGRGNALYVAAHRLPCTPTVRNWSFPHFAKSQRLKRVLELPLEKTDYLPKLVNYADRLFEGSGGREAIVRAVGFVLHEQQPQKEINLSMIRHATFDLLKKAEGGYLGAYQTALDLAEANKNGIDVLDPVAFEHAGDIWSSESTVGSMKDSRENMELVRFALLHSMKVASSNGDPFMLAPTTATQYVARLEALDKEL